MVAAQFLRNLIAVVLYAPHGADRQRQPRTVIEDDGDVDETGRLGDISQSVRLGSAFPCCGLDAVYITPGSGRGARRRLAHRAIFRNYALAGSLLSIVSRSRLSISGMARPAIP
jgi:hypothetical protein